jgi:HPt (histidine-containing phosphotransfer) domain-containing protein
VPRACAFLNPDVETNFKFHQEVGLPNEETIAAKIVELMGGTIHIENDDGAGPFAAPGLLAETGEADGLEAMMHELRAQYMAAFADVLAEFDASAGDGDAAALGGLGHRLKGNGASYGFPEITQIGAEVEELSKTGGLEAILPLIAQLRRIHSESQSGLRTDRAERAPGV